MLEDKLFISFLIEIRNTEGTFLLTCELPKSSLQGKRRMISMNES
jgi:hypothetical protein